LTDKSFLLENLINGNIENHDLRNVRRNLESITSITKLPPQLNVNYKISLGLR